MADKSDRKPEAGGAGAGSRPGAAAAPTVEQKSGLLSKTPVLLTGVMIIEAIVLVAGFKILGGGPRRATAAELVAEAEKAGEKGAADRKKTVEVQVVEFKAPNNANGRTFLYDVSIYVITKAEFEQRVKDTFKDKGALIQDRIRTIIAESDPEKLGGGSEPGLETLRRQVKYQLDEIVGDGVIDEVLVPRCIPFRTDY
jgi:flagellar basal body-associated protein FliL